MTRKNKYANAKITHWGQDYCEVKIGKHVHTIANLGICAVIKQKNKMLGIKDTRPGLIYADYFVESAKYINE